LLFHGKGHARRGEKKLLGRVLGKKGGEEGGLCGKEREATYTLSADSDELSASQRMGGTRKKVFIIFDFLLEKEEQLLSKNKR